MQSILEIKAFFFNAKTDYLPYYKNFSFELTEEMKAKDLLALIQEQNENFSYPDENLFFKINHMIIDGEQNISEVVARVGTSLQVDPINSYRSMNGLIINDDDFMKSYELLAPFASEENLEYYKTLYATHYASETEKFDHSYIGDAVLLLAHKMISEGSEHKEEILEAICDPHSGLLDCEYENNFFHAQDHNVEIATLKMMAKTTPQKPSLIEMISSRFMKKPTEEESVEVSIKGKNIAYYPGSSKADSENIHQKIIEVGSQVVPFSREHKLSGLSLFEDNRALAFTKAGTTMLDALDSGAQVLIVEHETVLSMFKKYFPAIEKTVGRDIDLELISTEDFLAQADSVVA